MWLKERIMKVTLFRMLAVVAGLSVFSSCHKSPVTTGGDGNLSYGDSVFYLKSNTYTISPVNTRTGTYTAFPGNLLIDNSTGAITVALKGSDGQSQTGLKYKINFQSPGGGTKDSTFIILSGINYLDGFHDLSQNDSIISPVYNCDVTKSLPAGSYGVGADNKLAINTTNGQINVNESIRRGFFDDPTHSSWKQTTIKYTINDNSGGVQNEMDVILYHYNNLSDVPSNVSGLMQAHQLLSLSVNRLAIPSTAGPIDNNLSSSLSLSRPRPPCVVIIGH